MQEFKLQIGLKIKRLINLTRWFRLQEGVFGSYKYLEGLFKTMTVKNVESLTRANINKVYSSYFTVFNFEISQVVNWITAKDEGIQIELLNKAIKQGMEDAKARKKKKIEKEIERKEEIERKKRRIDWKLPLF